MKVSSVTALLVSLLLAVGCNTSVSESIGSDYSGAHAGGGSDSYADTDSDSDSYANTDSATDTGSDTGKDTGSGTGTGTYTDSDTDTDSGTDTATGADTDTDSGTDTATGADTDTDSDTDTGADTDSDSDSDTDVDTDVPVLGGPIGFAAMNGGTTGGQGGNTVTATSLSELQSHAGSSEKLIIMVEGTIKGPGKVGVSSNKSIIGVGSTAFLDGVGLEMKDANNIIVRNIKATLIGATDQNGGDVVSINGSSKNIWIDHCEFYSEDPEVQTDIDKYDGLIDIKHQTGFITVSWCYLHDHHKGCLIGASETDLYADRKVTYHHNYFNKVIKRMPMMRGSTGHFFNNYVYGTPSTEATFAMEDVCIRVEKNVYENVKYSVYSQTGDTRGYAEMIDNVAPQSRDYPGSCTADIPYDYSEGFIENTADVAGTVKANAGVGKM
jgi:pectate lyase